MTHASIAAAAIASIASEAPGFANLPSQHSSSASLGNNESQQWSSSSSSLRVLKASTTRLMDNLISSIFTSFPMLMVKTLPVRFGDGQLYTWTDGLKRKDWHDYEHIQKDAIRLGKGEQGKPYPLTEEDSDDSAYRENGFNIFVSNNIALERSLPDIRHPNCKNKLYLEKLPNTSIIIPFHNEGWTSLLRTIHSIINRTPNSLIAEIILVDDFSDRGLERKTVKKYE
ncbi:polypeptide N-acetylgalactosaminyltransferase-like 6 [Crotalus tigris]|uniref:polypeptide N-acetylgalactosaminyltransferase-like 6 n=1 Tax=Crotalus tigris TaxID=88082 RepID=UPI00192F1321|nr:polypeptide N-acetylgalactosaminyltransferase-like 6 [Crotalus tigris]